MNVKTIMVVGAGTMGHGIAEVAALRGFDVLLYDVKQEFLDNAISRIRWSLEKLAEKGSVRDVQSVLSRITTTLDLEASASKADFVVEAAPEKLELKRDIFSRLDRSAPRDAILATNTSSLPITEISEATSRRDKVIGMHFFNPPVIMPLVEVVRGKYTGDGAVAEVVELAKALGKEPVVVGKDVPGFIVNRIMARSLNTACLLVAKGLARVEEVDAAARYSLSLPMGPFELSDYIGIDVMYDIISAMASRGFRATPCQLYAEKYRAGEYGVKSGRGFYEYPGSKYRKPELDRGLAGRVDPLLIIAPAINEAAYLLREGVAGKEDIDKAVRLGLNYPKGIFEYADEFGLSHAASALERLGRSLGSDEFSPDPLLLDLARRGGKFYGG